MGSGESHDITMGVAPADPHPYTVGSKVYADTVEDLSGGNISINVQTGGQYGGEVEQLELLQDGNIDMVGGSLGLMEAILINQWWVLNGTCFIYPQDDPLGAFQDFWTAYLETTESPSILAEEGAMPLIPDEDDYANGFHKAAMRHIIASQRITTPAEADGVRFRAAPSPYMLNAFNGIGFNAEVMPINELRQAANRGVVTASEGDPGQISGAGLEEIMSHYMLTNHLAYGFWYSAHTEFFKSLPSADQQVLRQAVKRSKEPAEQEIQDLNDKNVQAMKDAGIEFVDDFDIEPMREAAIEGQRSIFDEHSQDVPMTLDEITDITLG
jgi:TRAP-type C4-dicarboxylate transport system substrate-binding protein